MLFQRNYLNASDVDNLSTWIEGISDLKKNPRAYKPLGKDKTLGMLFFNPSLRTRMSTQKAAQNLGMEVIVMDLSTDSWSLEFANGSVMNNSTAEHIKEAAAVISQYCDIIAIRAFPSLSDRTVDESEFIINSFKKYATVPILNMESATAHPLQGLTDALTIKEQSRHLTRPKVVLSWVPHPKKLPHAVPNSFINFVKQMNVDLVIAQPKGYELNAKITKGISVAYDQEEAFKEADFVYAKNWSSYSDYGKILLEDNSWMITEKKMSLGRDAKFMHCLPVRRNVVVTDEVLDSKRSIVIQQANNRTFVAQYVIKKLLENGR